MRKIRYLAVCLWLLFAMAVLCRYGTDVLYARSRVSGVQLQDLEGADFREQRLDQALISELWELYGSPQRHGLSDAVAATMLMGQFYPDKIYTEAPLMEQFKSSLWKESRRMYRAVWADLECFPVRAEKVFYENSWMSPRGKDKERHHEGCDLFGEEDRPGLYPVVSMTDGTVEQIGWLPLGGYRIGIRSEGGGYFYYAHLDSYESEFQEGESIRAGQILGFMGNTGYGPEGTKGEFATHLHLGIYVRTENHPELSVNPYWILRYIQGHTYFAK